MRSRPEINPAQQSLCASPSGAGAQPSIPCPVRDWAPARHGSRVGRGASAAPSAARDPTAPGRRPDGPRYDWPEPCGSRPGRRRPEACSSKTMSQPAAHGSPPICRSVPCSSAEARAERIKRFSAAGLLAFGDMASKCLSVRAALPNNKAHANARLHRWLMLHPCDPAKDRAGLLAAGGLPP